ncbi:MAG: RND family transporter [Spirochaetaceae bacterium]|nr:MAG: RND family transporter [Spirochaetaceae bacterium]
MDRVMRHLLRYPALVAALALAVTVLLGLQIPGIEINNNVEVFVPPASRQKQAYDEMRDIYGSQQMVSVAMHVERGTVLHPEHIRTLRELTGRIEELPYVDSVTSLTNADYIEGTAEGMQATTLLPAGDDLELSADVVRRRLFDWQEMYRGNLVSDDFRATQVVVLLDAGSTTAEREVFHHALTLLLDEYRQQGLNFHVGGEPVITVMLKEYMIGDLTYLIPLVTLVVLLVLYLSFRSFCGVLLPMITVLMSTTWAVGIMALLDIYFSMISTVIPVLLIAVGSAYVIHLFSRYYDQVVSARYRDARADSRSQRELVLSVVSSMGKPVALTALTTAAGFASIATSEIIPMRHFGIINAVGVLAALVITLLFVPSLLLLRPPLAPRRPRPSQIALHPDQQAQATRIERFLLALHDGFGRHRGRVLAAGTVIVALCVYGTLHLQVDNAMIDYFEARSPIRAADEFLRSEFSGTKVFSILVEGHEPGALTNPHALAAMDDLAAYLERTHPDVGRVLSFSDFIKRMNKVMNFPQEDRAASVGPEASFAPQVPDRRDADPGAYEDAHDDYNGFSSFFDDWDDPNESHPNGPDAPEDAHDRAPGEPGDRHGFDDAAVDDRPAAMGTAGALTAAQLAELMSAAYAAAPRMDLSAADLVRLISRAANYRGEAYNEIPLDPARYPVEDIRGLQNLISQYLLVYAGNLDDFADDALEPRRARMLVQLRSTSTQRTAAVSEDALAFAGRHFPEGYRVSVAGFADIERAVTELIVTSQLTSIAVALVIVFLIVALAYRSVMAGLFGIVPLSLAIVINFGVMGLTGIQLNVATAMIASISIGIGVDYTIHFLAAYRNERAACNDLDEVTRRTLLSTGKAIFFNATSVGAGFLVLALSNFTPLRYVGLLVGLTMFTASAAAMTVLPVLLNMFQPQFITAEEAPR